MSIEDMFYLKDMQIVELKKEVLKLQQELDKYKLVASGELRFAITNQGKLNEERFSTYIDREDITEILQEYENQNIAIYIKPIDKE